jgi:O-antigen/teichoic acid export membrane protein
MVKKNILANLAGNIWSGLMSLIFVPLYIHFIGIEGYGLMGIFSSLLALFALFDMGLSSTLNREIARLSVQVNKNIEMRDLVRTLEIPYWGFGLIVAIIIILLSPLISYHWVNAKAMSPQSIRLAIILMGLAVAFQWPIAFYSGGLMGLQRQVLLNGINIVVATLRGLGAVIVLWLVSPTVEAFFIWQVAIFAVHVLVVAFFLWRSLPTASVRPCFRRDLLENIWRFAAGMTTLAITATVLRQTDKVILSRMLSLEQFGYYSLATVASMTLFRILGPIFESIYPQFTRLVEMGDENGVINLYHKSAQLVSVLILSSALIISFFSREILLIWTRNPITAGNTHLLVSILVMGTAFNCIIHVPYALQIAHGWTRLAFFVDAVSVLVLIPLMIILTKWFGAAGAAYVWVILNVGYVFISVPIMHRRLITKEKWIWYIQDLGRPFLAAIVVVMIGRLLIRENWSPMQLMASIGMLSLGTLFASACASNRLGVIERMGVIVTRMKRHA